MDGTFNFFRKVDGHWHLSEDVYADYFVNGNLLCTRWKNVGEGQEERREWWEIESIEEGVMKWKALRLREDGTTYTATFEMKKVDVPTQAEVEQFILGKWMNSEINGQDVPTNNKNVCEFESLTKAYMSASFNSAPELASIWANKSEYTVVIDDNHIALSGQKDEKTAILDEFIVSYITADVMQCVIRHTEILDNGEMVTTPEVFCTFKKVDQDFSEAIIGTWEGQVTSDQDTYGDGQQHRWEYKADGTYVYYVKDGDNWVPSTNTLNEYFVAGTLLCSRWINDGTEYREWWEIDSIEDGIMKWKALRMDADGNTFYSTFEMVKTADASDVDVTKCTRATVQYWLSSPKTNYTFFEGKYAIWSGDEKQGPTSLIPFTDGENSFYQVNNISTFPHEEAYFLHYGVKDLESYEGVYQLNWGLKYVVTTYNANGDVLDSKEISDEYNAKGQTSSKADLEPESKLSYIEMHASIAEDGTITLTKAKMHPEDSGIEW
jgi:hypothetical protein